MMEISIISMQAATLTFELKMMNAGLLLKEMLENINNKNHQKIYLYSGHDLTVMALTESLEIENFGFPGFGSALILETWLDIKNKNETFFKVFIGRNSRKKYL